MILYLIKSGLCLVVLLAIYLVLLEREKMHRFNRFFLLGALLLGLTVPFINFELFPNPNTTSTETQFAAKLARNSATVVTAVTNTSSKFVESALESKPAISNQFEAKDASPEATESKIDSKEAARTNVQRQSNEIAELPEEEQSTVPESNVVEPNTLEVNIQESNSKALLSLKEGLISIYILVSLILGTRLVYGLVSFYRKRRSHPLATYGSAHLALLSGDIVPHTFLNTIYVNKEDFETGSLSKQILDHELTHAKEKHSLDVLFIEILRIVFWFNPIFYFYKRAIQINHEFLADESVIEKTKDSISYQKLLIESVFPSYKTNLASSFNYSLTKKRFKMMVKESSLLATISKKVILLPILACIVFIFCTEVSDYNKTYEIDGEVYKVAFAFGANNYSDTILLNNYEERMNVNHPRNVKYYDLEGNLYTGEIELYGREGLFNQKKEKPYMKINFDKGMRVSREVFNTGRWVSVISEYEDGKLLKETMSSNDTLMWKVEYSPDSKLRFSQMYNRGKLGIEHYSTGYKYEQYFYKLATVYDDSGNIKNQERYNEEGERIPITNEYLEEKLGEVRETYLESVSDYFGLNIKNFTQQELNLKYSEVINNRQRLIAFMNKVNPKTNRSDEILIPRKMVKKEPWEHLEVWSSDKIYTIDGIEFIEASVSNKRRYSTKVLYNLLDERKRYSERSVNSLKYFNKEGSLFSGELNLYEGKDKPLLFAEEGENIYSKNLYDKGRMIRSEGNADDGNKYKGLNKYNNDNLSISYGFKNDTLFNIITYDLESEVDFWQMFIDGNLFNEYSATGHGKTFKIVGLSTRYDESNNIVDQKLRDEEGNEKPLTEEYLEGKYKEVITGYEEILSKYLNLSVEENTQEEFHLAYSELKMASLRWRAFQKELNITEVESAVPPLPAFPTEFLKKQS